LKLIKNSYMIDYHPFIRQCIDLAWQSAENGFDPFAALLIKDGEVVAKSADQCIRYSDPTAHAELSLISEYCRAQKCIDLAGFTLVANVEPCLMCCGAIHWAKIERVVFSVPQSSLQKKSKGRPKPSSHQLLNLGGRKVEVIGPILEEEGQKVLQAFPWKSKVERHDAFWKL
ncbi:MAG: nucleoside deaminase, partial [Bacteroidota bacterium]